MLKSRLKTPELLTIPTGIGVRLGVGGDKPRHSVPPYRFPPAVQFPSTYPLGDALLGRRRYNDPQVIQDCIRILAADDNIGQNYVRDIRSNLVENYRQAFQQLVELEKSFYGNNSYFAMVESSG